jgi:hypothetical protein
MLFVEVLFYRITLVEQRSPDRTTLVELLNPLLLVKVLLCRTGLRRWNSGLPTEFALEELLTSAPFYR